ncbi:MAG: NAD(P)H-hydrate dehydratase [Clostridia bacterium]|nr:NAD(P)H-hydrate dehydratase [Clostridia bacterium]
MKRITEALIKKLLPRRDERGDKRDAGALLCVCGSEAYPGAALISTRAAYRSGAGLVYLLSAPSVCLSSVIKTPECVVLPCGSPEDALSLLSSEKAPRVNAILYGCGVGDKKENAEALKYLLKTCSVPLIIDADGLNILSRHIYFLEYAACPVILTPHSRERTRLLEGASLSSPEEFSAKYGVTLVCKGAETRVFSGGKEYGLDAPCSALAKGGSGDALAGITASFACQGAPALSAALCGVYVHSEAGKYLSETLSPYSALPSDLCDALPEVFKRLSR